MDLNTLADLARDVSECASTAYYHRKRVQDASDKLTAAREMSDAADRALMDAQTALMVEVSRG